MKIKSILTALLLMVAGVVTSWAQEGQILSCNLTLSINGGPSFLLPLTSQGYPDIDMTDSQSTSIVIKKVEAYTTGSIASLSFGGTMFKQKNGSHTNPEWRFFPMAPTSDGYWVLDMGEGVDLIDESMGPDIRVFQFRAQGTDGSGNDIFFNNGGQDYKLLFTTGEVNPEPSNPIKSLTLTINCDGEQFTQSLPADGWENIVISGKTKSLKILRAEVETDVPMSYVGFCATMYNAEDGWQHNDDEWRWIDLVNQGDGLWVLDMGEGTELVESKWLNENKTKTFEFFVQAGDSNDNTYYYANGVNEYGYRNNYKVTFSTGPDGGGGEDTRPVRFLDESAAAINLKVNGQDCSYIFDGDGTRLPDQPLGDLYSLTIDGFYLSCIFSTYTMYDATMQYKVYEADGDGQWNGIKPDDTLLEEMFDHETQKEYYQLFCLADGIGLDVSSGLEYGKDYVLELMFQVIAYDNYYFLGRDMESTRFPFHYDNETGIRTIDNGQLTMDKGTFNLSGQRVGKDYKGIVVSNGKKVLRK